MPLIPTHVLFGRLGVGKTTLLRHWIAHKPAHERWAILVNEAGRIGLDGLILQAADAELGVREIAGGCVCCSVGPQFRVGLQRLIQSIKPDRLFIEPSGVAEPLRLLDQLQAFAGVLRLEAMVALFDAREPLSGQDAWQLADILVANKCDLATDAQREAFVAAADARYPPAQAVFTVTQATLPLMQSLSLYPLHYTAPPTGSSLIRPQRQRVSLTEEWAIEPVPGGVSCGRIFPEPQRFERAALDDLWAALASDGNVWRAKGVFRCGQTAWLYQLAAGAWQREPIAWRRDSRVNLILAEMPAEPEALEVLWSNCLAG